MQAVATVYEETFAAPSRSHDYGRLRLESALREAAAAPPSWFGSLSATVEGFSFTRAFAVAVVAVALCVAAFIAVRASRGATFAALPPGTLPDSSLTPGAVSQLTAAELCNGERPSRFVTETVRDQVLRVYGMQGVSAAAFELDALVTPELGGSTDPANLWPQRYQSPVWNARVKDELERLLPELVCSQQITLAEAQREIASDWVAAYKRRFKTDRPLHAHMTGPAEEEEELVFVSDEPASTQMASLRIVTP
jgi:hypothetical protein